MINLNSYIGIQTLIFTALFLVAVFISVKKKTNNQLMSKETSNELRGLAILGILFAHLTYGKFYGTDFLFPLGIWAGVAVNLFFFLSGYGLAASAIYHPKSYTEFFKKRILKIYLPLWIFLVVIILADALILNRQYPLMEILYSFVGFFPEANLFTSINSPLWFLTPLLFYYLIFPIIFRSKHPRWSVLVLFVVSYLLAFEINWPVTEQIQRLYQSHWLGFPLGALLANLIVSPQAVCAVCLRKDHCWSYKWILSVAVKGADTCFKPLAKAIAKLQSLSVIWRIIILTILSALAWQTAYHSGVGKGLWPEQGYALFTMSCLILLFLFKKTRFNLLEIFGIYSFEIYLWHWPLMGRYDLLYQYLPLWLATLLYLPLLLFVAYLFNKLALAVVKKIPI